MPRGEGPYAVLGAAGKVLVKRNFTPKQLLTYTANLQTSLIGLEACAGTSRHGWASYRGSIPPAARPGCSASASAATYTCARCLALTLPRTSGCRALCPLPLAAAKTRHRPQHLYKESAGGFDVEGIGAMERFRLPKCKAI